MPSFLDVLNHLSSGTTKVSQTTIPVYSQESFQATITSANATSATTIKTGDTGKIIYITDMIISVDTAMNVQIQDSTGTPVVMMEQVYLPANSVFSKQFKTPLKTSVSMDAKVVTSASGNISVTITGYLI